MKSNVKLTRHLVYIFVFIVLAGFINPPFSLAKSNELSISQIINNAAEAKKTAKKAKAKAAATKKAADRAANRAAIKSADALKAVAEAVEAKKTASNKAADKAARKAEAKAAAAEKAKAKATAAKKAADRASAEAVAAEKAAEKAVNKLTLVNKVQPTPSNKTADRATDETTITLKTYVDINSLRDLGMDKGYVCFRIKAYSSTEVSEFSKPACTYIKNSNNFRLAWTNSSDVAIGYQVYFGNSAKKTKNFLADIK